MAVWNLYSKRQKQLRGEYPDVYVYDELPDPFRVQVVHIIKDAIGMERDVLKTYQVINDVLCREYGVFELHNNKNIINAVFNFFIHETSVEKALDFIELSFKFIDGSCRARTFSALCTSFDCNDYSAFGRS